MAKHLILLIERLVEREIDFVEEDVKNKKNVMGKYTLEQMKDIVERH